MGLVTLDGIAELLERVADDVDAIKARVGATTPVERNGSATTTAPPEVRVEGDRPTVGRAPERVAAQRAGMLAARQRAWREGVAARQEELAEVACPYKPTAFTATAWLVGHRGGPCPS